MIRKVITTVIISLVTLNYIQAQDKFKRELSLGASFGTTFSKVSFAQTKVQQKMKMGYTGGLTLRWITEKNLGLQAELNFIQHGWDEKFEDQPQYKYSRTINYFELPILTHIYFGSKRFRVFVNLGPKIGYAFGEKTDENLNGAKPNTGKRTARYANRKEIRLGIMRWSGYRTSYRNWLFPPGGPLLLCPRRHLQQP